ncbi:putative NTE family protein [Paraburkholderia domus]|jgi:NTE family protein|uniref:NTE family protein n=1 Tax=Paraburkholderia domus TaxID=2793075 RepID=A0A9N8QX18_9BURK|nr:patatin-like phospholipase family protein [Paraburkholderia domus]MBK5049899.1 patatin-like phospholipase family protein [Burkholderia sp. R-70006]MBK5062935.1 patatin-like phospholipase family protein [Burkholderia sp. R-70199]MBK5086635.1 patatin-like phospholipase family protein [Burkholderia sp. R-69927]MBK5121357.1 patatin-like phospholipase family protein [Burkholderia sp. R-69980]MBK5166500.1 patatin-like phospholipase family protein [Burkholderia sp. R-70211]MBK5182375.1 patatin-li
MIRRRQYSRIGLVLGGGAARGWAHIGAIRALHDAGIKPDVVCGTSIGALVGAIYANGDLDWLEEWVSRLTWQTVVRLLDLRFSGGLLGGRKVIQIFADKFNGRSIAQLNIPFAAVATELDSGRESWLQDGSVVDAVRASIAIPGIFTPVFHNGVWLVDGGLSNPVPVSVARGMRADCVIAVDLNNDILNGRDFGGAAVETPALDPDAPQPVALRRNGKPWPRWLAPAEGRASDDVRVPPAPSTRVPSMLSSIAQSIDIMQVRISRSRLAGEPADILIQPRLGGMGIFDFHRAGPAIEEGRAAVEYMLPAIRARLGME